MSLIGYFLNKEDQTPSNIKYLHSLLAIPVHRLYKERELLAERSEALDLQIRSQALSESKEFVQALGNTKDVLLLKSGLIDKLNVCKQETLNFQTSIHSQTIEIEKILKQQQKLESLSNAQAVINEILEIPLLLKNLINSRHYKETLQLLKFIENIQGNHPVLLEIKETAESTKIKLKKDLTETLCDSIDPKKVTEVLGYLTDLKKYDLQKQIQKFFKCKSLQFNKLLKKNITPKAGLALALNYIHEYLKNLENLYNSLFKDYQDRLILFYIDIVSNILDLVTSGVPNTMSEVYEVTAKLLEINTEVFYPCGCNIWPEVYKIITDNVTQKLINYFNKTLTNFENLIKLYGWESSGTKDNPLQEFGSLAVLYNNTIFIINEIR
jgi:Dor1-like family